MGKLLRVSVVLLLLLALVATGLGYLLFQKRETLKGLTQDLAAEVIKTAKFIESSQDPDLTKSENPKMDKEIEVAQLLTYKLDPNVVQADTNKPATMKQTMGLLQGKAEAQLSILTDTRAALAQKIQELDTATNKIASLEADIVRLEGEKKELQDNVTTLQKEVAERKAKIEELNASLEEATGKITDLQADVAKLKDTILDQSDKIKTQEDTIKRLMEKLNPTGPTAGGSGTNGTSSLTSGTKGQILLVNKDYNFVVISLSAPAGIGIAQELTVQRGDKLVGKVRITEVSGQYPIAIADQLLAPWKQADAEVGDYVFH